ncbi:MAG: TIGR04282 family arsenosugar biosynthesis glycosyltransferase [Armatimonadetes bacterium]|nr:TIGR04282 family arsenosugar biosynthesis glycosyltransferase [Armatimonadota bacterium]
MPEVTCHGAGPVIAVMAKAPRPGCVKTRLLPMLSPEEAAELHLAFLRDTLARVLAVPSARAAVVCPAADTDSLAACVLPGVTVQAQTGAGLSAALHFALGHFHALGHDPVLLLDSDSPHLPTRYLRRALTELRESDLVVGPTDDGGYYLAGAHRPHPDLFEASSIGTDTALSSLLRHAADLRLRTALLPTWFDVDRPEDLSRLAAELHRDPGAAPETARCLSRRGL